MRQEDEGGQDELSALRAEVLEDYVTEPKTPHDEGHRSLLGRLRRSWRNMRPAGRVMLIGALAIVGLAVVAGSSVVLASIFAKPAAPAATPTFSAVPSPISISLPGGWIFPLKPPEAGRVEHQGCRVVSLPWTIQLEADLRKLKGTDEIKLSMSNYDSLLYKVRSVEQVPASEIDTLANNNAPCLLVILSREDTDTLWVLTAKP